MVSKRRQTIIKATASHSRKKKYPLSAKDAQGSMICGAAVIGFVVNLITYGLVSGLTAINIGRAVVGLVVCPLVTYLLAKNDWDYLS